MFIERIMLATMAVLVVAGATAAQVPSAKVPAIVDAARRLIEVKDGWLAAEEMGWQVDDQKLTVSGNDGDRRRVRVELTFLDGRQDYNPSAAATVEVDSSWQPRRYLSYERDGKSERVDVAVPASSSSCIDLTDVEHDMLLDEGRRLAALFHPELTATDVKVRCYRSSCVLDVTRSDKRVALVRFEFAVRRSGFGVEMGFSSDIEVGLPPDWRPATFLRHNETALALPVGQVPGLTVEQQGRIAAAAKLIVGRREPELVGADRRVGEVSVALDPTGRGLVAVVRLRSYGASDHILKDNGNYVERTVHIGLDDRFGPRVYLQYEGAWVEEPPFLVPSSVAGD